MPAARRDDMYWHAAIEQKSFMASSQVVESQPSKAELPRSSDKTSRDGKRITGAREIKLGARQGGENQRPIGEPDER